MAKNSFCFYQTENINSKKAKGVTDHEEKFNFIIMGGIAALVCVAGLSACGEEISNGKSAYDIYVETYIQAKGTSEGVLSEDQWHESLKGNDGKGVSDISIICGDCIITYSDNTKETLKNVFPEFGHTWNQVEITTNATCTTSGIIKYTCTLCNAAKKELLDADGSTHVYREYQRDSKKHSHICNFCNHIEESEHAMSEWSVDSSVYYADTHTVIGTVEKRGCEECGYSQLKALPSLGYKFIGWDTGIKDNVIGIYNSQFIGRVEAIFQKEVMELPIMEINTKDAAEIVSKDDYLQCTVTVGNAEESHCFEQNKAKIKGRGNSTWSMPKKPYKLKFDQKIDLFGNGSAKTWTLIANYCDPSLIRNYLAYTVGAGLENIRETTTLVQFVDVYLNGRYDGVYLICEQNETGKTRVDIEDDFEKATTPQDMGYLLEMDARAPSEGEPNWDYIVVNGFNYAIKSPDYEDIEDTDVSFLPYVNYIKTYMQDSWTALASNNFALVEQYINVESFVDSYIVHELFNMIDVGYSSFYVYKKENRRLYSGPIWDFDVSAGNCNYHESGAKSDYLWAADTNIWYANLLKYQEFKGMVSKRLLEKSASVEKTLINAIQSVYDCKNSFERNFERWNILGSYVWPNTEEIVAIKTWEEQVEYVRKWLNDSLNYINSVYRL